MKKKVIAALLTMALTVSALTGCTASGQRAITDIKSNFNGGLDRVIRVYTADGQIIAEYEGKIDIGANEGGYVKFDFNGKRYIYYNCFVETIAEI